MTTTTQLEVEIKTIGNYFHPLIQSLVEKHHDTPSYLLAAVAHNGPYNSLPILPPDHADCL